MQMTQFDRFYILLHALCFPQMSYPLAKGSLFFSPVNPSLASPAPPSPPFLPVLPLDAPLLPLPLPSTNSFRTLLDLHPDEREITAVSSANIRFPPPSLLVAQPPLSPSHASGSPFLAACQPPPAATRSRPCWALAPMASAAALPLTSAHSPLLRSFPRFRSPRLRCRPSPQTRAPCCRRAWPSRRCPTGRRPRPRCRIWSLRRRFSTPQRYRRSLQRRRRCSNRCSRCSRCRRRFPACHPQRQQQQLQQQQHQQHQQQQHHRSGPLPLPWARTVASCTREPSRRLPLRPQQCPLPLLAQWGRLGLVAHSQ